MESVMGFDPIDFRSYLDISTYFTKNNSVCKFGVSDNTVRKWLK